MPFINYAEFLKDKPMLLDEDDIKNPLRIIDLFFSHYDLNDFRKRIDEWYVIATSSNVPDMDCSLTRNGIYFLYHSLRRLIEANYVMFNKHLPIEHDCFYEINVESTPKESVNVIAIYEKSPY